MEIGFYCVRIDNNLRILQTSDVKNSPFVCSDATSIPFADKSFDCVVAFDLLEHTDDMAVLKEVARVTRRRAIFAVPFEKDALWYKAGFVFNHYIDVTHHRYYTLEGFRGILTSSGLKIIGLYPYLWIEPRRVIRALLKPGWLFLAPLLQLLSSGFVRRVPTACIAVAEVP